MERVAGGTAAFQATESCDSRTAGLVVESRKDDALDRKAPGLLVCTQKASHATRSAKPPCPKGVIVTTAHRLTLGLIHTSPTLTPAFTALCKQHLPETSIFHMVDESLIQETIRAGRLQRSTMRRVVDQVGSAVDSGADAVLVTCSSIGPAVTLAQQLFDVPVLRIDDAMAETAVREGRRLGVLATLRTTMDPTTALLRQKAADAGREVELVECLCEDAFPAVLAGDTETHDRLLRKALLEDLQGVDVIVLAQASMARVVATLEPGALKAPVLSSPELAVQRAREVLLGARAAARISD
jgi:Asp/Glu/hydantoin racemase